MQMELKNNQKLVWLKRLIISLETLKHLIHRCLLMMVKIWMDYYLDIQILLENIIYNLKNKNYYNKVNKKKSLEYLYLRMLNLQYILISLNWLQLYLQV